jgi:hypothetical protein
MRVQLARDITKQGLVLRRVRSIRSNLGQKVRNPYENMDTSYSGISEKLSGFEMSNGFRVIEGYRENSDTKEYRNECYREISRQVLSRDIVTNFIARYRDEFYRELSRRVVIA